MKADDPRHGQYRGWAQHMREGGEACGPCTEARRAYHRKRPHLVALGHALRLEVGPHVHAIVSDLADLTEREWRDLTGVSAVTRRRILEGGAKTVVRTTTRNRLAALAPSELRSKRITIIGVTRRVQALTRLGHSATSLADRMGMHPATLRKIQGGDLDYVEYETRRRVDQVYRELENTPCLPVTNITARAFNLAERNGWPAPAAWDDIDDPDTIHNTNEMNFNTISNGTQSPKEFVDPVVVDRLLDGETTVRTSLAERREVVRRWTRSHAELARLTGWKVERYICKDADQETPGDAA